MSYKGYRRSKKRQLTDKELGLRTEGRYRYDEDITTSYIVEDASAKKFYNDKYVDGYRVKVEPFEDLGTPDKKKKSSGRDYDYLPCLCDIHCPPPAPPPPPAPAPGLDVHTHVHTGNPQAAAAPPNPKKLDCPLHYPYGGKWVYPHQPRQHESRYDEMRRQMQYYPYVQFSPGPYYSSYRR